jgi:hypothetical protein
MQPWEALDHSTERGTDSRGKIFPLLRLFVRSSEGNKGFNPGTGLVELAQWRAFRARARVLETQMSRGLVSGYLRSEAVRFWWMGALP